MTGQRRLAAAAACAAAVLATRVPFLAGSLDDIDAVNFALAVADFDPASHQPHPPGYAVYVLAAKAAASGAAPGELARALALLSAVAQAALPLPLFLLFRRLGAGAPVAAVAAALTLLNPVVWMNGVRPMSDSLGLLVAVGAQAMLLGAAAAGRGLAEASALAGLAAGVRVQTLALTLPLWTWAIARARRPRAGIAALALAAGVLAWALPTVVESGGPGAYWLALAGTAADAAPVEPLALTWTLNRAGRAARHVLLRPWGVEWLGVVMGLLAVGGLAAARRAGVSLRLAAVAFVPYLVAHALFQQAHTQRYAIPYVPLLALLAAIGMDAAARAAGPRAGPSAFLALAAAGAAACVAVALPGVAAYAAADAPAVAALRSVRRLAPDPGRFVLSGHYMFRRYFAIAPPAIPLLPQRPRHEIEGVQEFWRTGGERPVLFVAEPRRTDLESIDPRARIPRGRWAWPRAAARLLSGERPDAAALVELRPPAWFAGTGWGLSLEMAAVGGVMDAERTAWLRPSTAETLVMVAGEPTGPAADWQCELSLGGRALDRRSCGTPWLAAHAIPPGIGKAYVPLAFTTSRAGAAAGAPFALRGLAYGSAGEAMIVHGAGWHYPETARDGRPYRWISREARSLVNVPPSGGRLVVEGDAPRRFEAPAAIEIESGGLRNGLSASGHFRLELEMPPGPPREAVLRSDREFVPDMVQHNGDLRRLALRVDYFEVIAR